MPVNCVILEAMYISGPHCIYKTRSIDPGSDRYGLQSQNTKTGMRKGVEGWEIDF